MRAPRSALEVELRGQVRRYLGGQVSFHELQRWLAPRVWRPYASGDPETARLMSAVQIRLDEYAAGYWSEELLHESLRALMDREQSAE